MSRSTLRLLTLVLACFTVLSAWRCDPEVCEALAEALSEEEGLSEAITTATRCQQWCDARAPRVADDAWCPLVWGTGQEWPEENPSDGCVDACIDAVASSNASLEALEGCIADDPRCYISLEMCTEMADEAGADAA